MEPPARIAPQPRPPLLPPPDPALLLLEAVRRRDPLRSRQLAERWVHRQGLLSLETFLQRSLSAAAGQEAAAWLAELLLHQADGAGHRPQPPLSEPMAPSPASEERQHPQTSGQESAPQLGQQVIAEVDAAIAAMLATFPPGELAALEAASPAPSVLEPASPGWSAGQEPIAAAAAPAAAAEQQIPDFLLPQSCPAAFGPADQPAAAADPMALPLLTVSGSRNGADGEPAEPQEPAGDASPRPQEPQPGSEAEHDGPDLLQSLGQRLPAAARRVRALLAAAEPAIWWRSLTGSAACDQEKAADDRELLPAGNQEPEPEPGLEWSAVRESGSAPNGSDPEAAAETSPRARLRRQFSQQGGPALALPPPAPRPAGLAELRGWLPDGELPRAS